MTQGELFVIAMCFLYKIVDSQYIYSHCHNVTVVTLTQHLICVSFTDNSDYCKKLYNQQTHQYQLMFWQRRVIVVVMCSILIRLLFNATLYYARLFCCQR